jgi:hypothetical protein
MPRLRVCPDVMQPGRTFDTLHRSRSSVPASRHRPRQRGTCRHADGGSQRKSEMAIDSGYLKHLEMIAQTISRMAANSFLLKGWSVTLLSAILALTVKEGAYRMIWVAFLPCIMFWALDAYYLRQERLFRKLWDAQRAKNQEAPTDFSMNTQPFDAQESPWAAVMFSKTLLTFHGTLLLILVIVAAWTYCRL